MNMNKTFDCVRMRRQGAEQVMKQLEGKSLQEQLEYWQKGAEDLKKLQQKRKRTGENADSPSAIPAARPRNQRRKSSGKLR
jgi:hypothetical protein